MFACFQLTVQASRGPIWGTSVLHLQKARTSSWATNCICALVMSCVLYVVYGWAWPGQVWNRAYGQFIENWYIWPFPVLAFSERSLTIDDICNAHFAVSTISVLRIQCPWGFQSVANPILCSSHLLPLFLSMILRSSDAYFAFLFSLPPRQERCVLSKHCRCHSSFLPFILSYPRLPNAYLYPWRKSI